MKIAEKGREIKYFDDGTRVVSYRSMVSGESKPGVSVLENFKKPETRTRAASDPATR